MGSYRDVGQFDTDVSVNLYTLGCSKEITSTTFAVQLFFCLDLCLCLQRGYLSTLSAQKLTFPKV